MSWWNTLPAFAAALAIVFGPGGALAYFIGSRRLAVLCFAPLFTIAIIGVAGIAAGFVGLPWSVLPVLITTAASTATAWALRRFVLKFKAPADQPTSIRVWAGALIGLGLGALLLGRRLVQVIGQPENFAQRFDNVFHLNAIRYILETGKASSLTLGSMAGGEGGGAIYPSAWHSTAALIAQLAGSDVVIAENVFNILIGAVIWPLGMIFLVRQIVGPRPLALALTGTFSAGFAAFPISIMDFGPLYPNILSYSILPPALALVIGLCRLGCGDTNDRPMLWMGLAISVPALALSQTNGLLALLAFSLPLGLWVAARELLKLRKLGGRGRRMLKVAGISILSLAGFALGWKLLRPLVDYDSWAPFTSQTGAVGEIVLNGPIGRPATWAISILALIGMQRVLRNSATVWIFLCWLIPAILYFTTASSPKGPWRMLVTGGWYQDSYRLAALLPIFALVLAALGGLFLWDAARGPAGQLLVNVSRTILGRFSSTLPVLGAAVFVLAAALLSQWGTMSGIVQEAGKAYVMDAHSPIVDSDELALIQRLPSHVPADDVIAVNPWNGGSLAFALSGRKVTTYHMFSTNDADLTTINHSIGTADSNSETCQIARKRHIDYILDFGSSYLANAAAAQDFPGIDNVTSATTKVVDSQGHARLLQVTSCN